ncbi:hypothetical protein KUTeg_011452 [Tegillarca granosa]|uniref:B box-type domain-containing protein n=1 Tax=Tegillarca granosa TaxID=220873 RepID=A0ABQ9F532_TEGGR|nr:hypothetical protein KUTeg_011452 [Tegillarca granosa]
MYCNTCDYPICRQCIASGVHLNHLMRVDKYTPNEQPDEISPPNLVTRDVADQELKDLFGHLDMKTKPEVDQSLQMKIYDQSTIPDIDFKIISSFTSEKNHVVIKSYDQAWLWSIFERGISLVTSDGKVMQNINTNLDVFDATVSTSGDLFVTENGECLVTDKYGHIIISDMENSVVHVLDRDGKFIQYLITPQHGCDKPDGLDLDNHGRFPTDSS